MAKTLTVNLGERSYPIHFGGSLIADLKACVAGRTGAGLRLAVVTDEQVAGAQKALLREVWRDLPCLVLPAGEETKSLPYLGRIWDFLAEQRMDRSAALFAVGGGVIGDLAGFAAATFLRGIDFYQVPTTLLAMVDSSVGGKTGLNLKAGKNLAGAFHQPKGVFIATEVLRTLPAREFAAGMAEVIKTGLLGDAGLFGEVLREKLHPDHPALPEVIRRCCAIKAGIVQADERETAASGGRALLNLGHTFAHAIEQATGYGEYLHGEAVGIGLAAAARLSEGLELIPAEETARIETALVQAELPIRLREPLDIPRLMAAMARDKKVRQGMPRFVVLNKIGQAETREGVPAALVEEIWRAVGAV